MCRPGTRVIPLGGRTTCITSRPRSPVGAVRCGSRRRRARNSGRATPSLRHEPGVALSSWSTLHFHPVRRAAPRHALRSCPQNSPSIRIMLGPGRIAEPLSIESSGRRFRAERIRNRNCLPYCSDNAATPVPEITRVNFGKQKCRFFLPLDGIAEDSFTWRLSSLQAENPYRARRGPVGPHNGASLRIGYATVGRQAVAIRLDVPKPNLALGFAWSCIMRWSHWTPWSL
ncbi:hypothetical protein AB7M49_004477 [Bradyrhizobium elkanii]